MKYLLNFAIENQTDLILLEHEREQIFKKELDILVFKEEDILHEKRTSFIESKEVSRTDFSIC
jgi:hypothetical protein